MPPVQSLDEILAEMETAYAPVANIYQQQAAAIPAKYDTRRSALEGARVKGFDQIAGQAGRAGMSWGGFTQNEQADYLSDKFLPGMQSTYQEQDEEGRTIAKTLAELQMEKTLKAQGKRDSQMSSRSAWEAEERSRAFTAEQNRLDREHTSRENAASRGASAQDNSDPVQPFLDSFATFMKSNKKMATRQDQDKYIESLFNRFGIKDKGSRQIVWDAINSTYKRSGDPTKDWTYKR